MLMLLQEPRTRLAGLAARGEVPPPPGIGHEAPRGRTPARGASKMSIATTFPFRQATEGNLDSEPWPSDDEEDEALYLSQSGVSPDDPSSRR